MVFSKKTLLAHIFGNVGVVNLAERPTSGLLRNTWFLHSVCVPGINTIMYLG